MPCQGPSKDVAYKEGEIVFEEVMEMLVRKYKISDPRIPLRNPDGSISSYRGHFYTERLDAVKTLKKAIQEVIWNDACSSF